MTVRAALAGAGVLALLAAGPAAQERSPAPHLVPTGRAFARGDGKVARCLLRDDSAHTLTVGSEGDLVWWNLQERRPLRWIDPPDEPVLSLWLHPTEPWVVCGLAHDTALRVDLASGARQPLSPPQLATLTDRNDVAWITGGHGSAREVASRNGRYRLVWRNERLQREPAVAGQFFTGEQYWIANDGTVVEARGTSVRLHGLAFGDVTEGRVHCGPPQQLVFTPDGSHLAIVSLAATQIVDIAGNEIVRWEGSRIVQPGPGPGEFWLLTADAMRRWNATRRTYVGDPVTWRGRHLRLTEDSMARGPHLRPVIVRGGQPWTPEAARLPDGTFHALAFTRPRSPAPANGLEQYAWLGEPETALAFQNASDTGPPMLLTSVRGNGKFTDDRATLRRLGDDGATTHHALFDEEALWLTIGANGARVWVGLASGIVQGFDSDRLTPLAKVSFDTPLVDAVALGADHLLASTGRKLLRLDATTLAVVDEVPLPQGLPGADRLARSADGHRLAIARGSEVRIVTVE